MSTITFAPGARTSVVKGHLSPGGRFPYYVAAKAGQTMTVTAASGAGTVTFQVFGPDAVLARARDGMALVHGRTLPDAGPTDDARAWIGAIPRDGNYLILVGMAANASAAGPYTLEVALQ
ncbi:MAG: hypothetical protein ACOY4R_19310 [Pseudomonadota bacterium]